MVPYMGYIDVSIALSMHYILFKFKIPSFLTSINLEIQTKRDAHRSVCNTPISNTMELVSRLSMQTKAFQTQL